MHTKDCDVCNAYDGDMMSRLYCIDLIWTRMFSLLPDYWVKESVLYALQSLRQFLRDISSISICYQYTPMRLMRAMHTMKTLLAAWGHKLIGLFRNKYIFMWSNVSTKQRACLDCWPHFAIVISIYSLICLAFVTGWTPLNAKCPVHTMKIGIMEQLLVICCNCIALLSNPG